MSDSGRELEQAQDSQKRTRRFEGGMADGRRLTMDVARPVLFDGPVDGPMVVTYLWTGESDPDGTEIWALEDDPRVVARQAHLRDVYVGPASDEDFWRNAKVGDRI